jgi:putative nucleotidyltransferase with HDIG domain
MSSHKDCLVLLVDDDKSLCLSISNYLSRVGVKAAIASNGLQAIEMFELLNPNIVVADLQLQSFDSIKFLEATQAGLTNIPVILTTSQADISNLSDAINKGAYDYLQKPFQPELLFQKISQALQSSKLVRENIVLNELVSLYDITNKLTSTHDLDELLDITFNYCLQISRADSGCIQLVDKDSGELVIVRSKGENGEPVRALLTDKQIWPVAKWVALHGRSLLVNEGKTTPSTNLNIEKSDFNSSVSAPLKIADNVIGIVNLHRKNMYDQFNPVELNIIDVLASQAGIAINNANLYASINQKLDELMIISNYSEQLMGLVDKYDVIRCLYETIIKYFPLDFIGFLIIQRRSHEFLYWSRGEIEDKDVKEITKNVLDIYNKAVNSSIQERRVAIRKFAVSNGNVQHSIKLPFVFKHTIPVCWEDFKFGAIFFGASKVLYNTTEKIALLSSLVSQTRIALTNSKLYSDMKENYIRTIKALAIAVDAKDTYTHGHSENVMNIAEEIAHEMNIDEKTVGVIRDAGLLHDIGKIGIPGHILNKPGPLTYEEFNGVMKMHSILGANIVKDVPFLKDLYKLILYHHEHYDGNGYPDGLKGEQIPIGARILHVADAFEAMTSNRPYRNSLGQREAVKRLTECSGQQFDPSVINSFLRVAKRKKWIED